ncbi:MAG TPA: hypothetical protein VMT12_09470 [Syntrophales bacterium]|nr:hypothetical protein [Syntrophales bacterium]
MRKTNLTDHEEIRRQVQERIDAEKPEINKKEVKHNPEQEESRYFRGDAGYLCRTKRTKDGPVTIRLANFDALITDENIVDDGQETMNIYSIEGRLRDGKPLPKVEVSANQFAGMTWIHKWGSGAIVEPGQTTKDYIRHRIHTASHTAGIATKTHFGHTGWRKIDGNTVYLHADGAIGNGGDISIRLPKELLRYSLPLFPPENAVSEKKALEASLSFLDIGDHAVMIPLFCGIYLAPLTTLLDPLPNFSLYLYGQSGTFKSTLAVLGLAHFGKFNGVESLSNLDDSVANLEKRLFILKDSLAVVDDFYPSPRRIDKEGMANRVARIIRNQGNRTARGRMTPTMEEKPRLEPRGMLLITGEDLPGHESTLARIHVIEVTDHTVDKHKLTELQRCRSFLSVAMSSYISWVRENLPDIVKYFPERFIQLRDKASVEGFHRRLPEQMAFLRFSLETAVTFMTERKALTDSQASALVQEGWQVFKGIADKQQQRIADDDPVKLLTDILVVLVTQHKVRINHVDEGEDLGAGNMIGFYDASCLYLYFTAVWHELNFFLQRQSDYFAFSKSAFIQTLKDRRIIQPSPAGENTTVVKIKGKPHRVIKIIDTNIYKAVTGVTP